MDTKQKLAVWESTVLGTPLDVDRAYGAQCADVAPKLGHYRISWHCLAGTV
jgi:hypothetical protein